jgi:RNA 2',3'-cyclic 3'-phosphodiesterase
MRAFIAIELPQNIKDHISRLQDKLKKSGADVKWVSPSNIHLTLKFLGEIDEKTRDGVCACLVEIAAHTPRYTVKLGSLGAFPGIQSPRIIWIGLSLGHDQTRSIADQLENNLEKYGIDRETRPFSSHITIGRVRSQKNKDDLVRCISGLESSMKENLGEFQAEKITLFKSTLLPQGPIYGIIQETNLKTT